MAKRTLSKYQIGRIEKMTYRDLVKQIEAGKLSEKQLREYYTQARDKEVKRIKRIEKAFGDEYSIPEPSKLKSIVGIRNLVSAIADVNKELNRKKNTLSGYRKYRQQTISILQEKGIPVDDTSFREWRVFMKWFNNSAWVKRYDSDSPDLIKVFEEAPQGTPEVWQSLLQEMQKEQTD